MSKMQDVPKARWAAYEKTYSGKVCYRNDATVRIVNIVENDQTVKVVTEEQYNGGEPRRYVKVLTKYLCVGGAFSGSWCTSVEVPDGYHMFNAGDRPWRGQAGRHRAIWIAESLLAR